MVDRISFLEAIIEIYLMGMNYQYHSSPNTNRLCYKVHATSFLFLTYKFAQ